MGTTKPERSDVFELTEQDLVEQAVVRYGGRYELLSLVGAGAYGSVYRARDTELEETVAVKVLRREHIVQPDALERFRREVRLARRVAHPNVARTYDIGSHKDERFLTMEYIDGHPLTRLSPISAAVPDLLPLRLVIDVVVQLCAGLGALHAAGIIHRDIKTDNVLVGHDGRVVITDFGIARAIQAADGAGENTTTSSELTGTPAYMAPEQVRGHGRVDTRADLYALGVMLFQMLTGRLPFTGATAMETALARLYEAPRDPLVLRPSLPKALAELLRRSLRCNPDERFQTADELATAVAAERPSGPDLGDYLRARALTAKRGMTPAARWSLNQQMSDPAAEVTASQVAGTVRSAPLPPLPLLHSAPGSRQLAVTVLLFKFAGDMADEYLAHGLTEELIDRLSEAEGLLLTSFGAVRALLPDQRDPSELGQKLRAQVIVDGTLRLVPGGLSATVRLVEVERGLQLAVRRFERSDRNALALALDVAQVLGGLLTVHVGQSAGDMVGDAVAVNLYMQARHRYNCMTADGAAESVVLFAQALLRLPDDPTLLASHAQALARLWFFNGEGAAERATEAAERAVRAAPDRGESYLAQATVHLNANRYIEAAVALRSALARAERSAEAHELYGHLLSETGPVEAALRHLNYAMMLDKSVPRVRFSLSRIHTLDGQLDAALALLNWEGSEAGFAAIRWAAMTRLLCWHQDRPRARALLADPALAVPALARPRERLEFLAGDRWLSADEFVPVPYKSASVSPRGRLFGMQVLIEYHCLLGQFDSAMQVLQQSVGPELIDLQWLDRCPLLFPLQTAPSFSAVRAQVAEAARRVQRALGVSTD